MIPPSRLRRAVEPCELYTASRAHKPLADMLLTGMTLREAADTIGIAETTARSHLKSIFRTIGISGQANSCG